MPRHSSAARCRQITLPADQFPTPAYHLEDFEAALGNATPFDRFPRIAGHLPGVPAMLRPCSMRRVMVLHSRLRRIDGTPQGRTCRVRGLAGQRSSAIGCIAPIWWPAVKPAPDIFLHAAHEMEVQPDRCIVIEDSPAGVQAARAAGMRTLGFSGGSHLSERKAEHGAVLKSLNAEDVFEDLGLVRDWISRIS